MKEKVDTDSQLSRLQMGAERLVDRRQVAAQASDFRVRFVVVVAQPKLSLATQRHQMVETVNAHLETRKILHSVHATNSRSLDRVPTKTIETFAEGTSRCRTKRQVSAKSSKSLAFSSSVWTLESGRASEESLAPKRDTALANS